MAHSMTSNSSSPDVPPFNGFVETTVHALRLIHAARQGVIPRITRRLNDAERRTMVHSGAVFVFSVEESGIKRWTDGLLWSPSRIVGNFLVYREINERNSSRTNHKKSYPSDDSSRSEHRSFGFKGLSHAGLPTNDHGTFKPNGLIKKTITVTIEGSDLHLISYYTSDDVRSGKLKRPTSRPDIMALHMPPHIFRLTNFRNPPKVDIGPDGKPRLVCESEEMESAGIKVEETTYNGHNSPTWSSDRNSQTSQSNKSYGSNSLSAVTNPSVDSSSFYSNSNSADRWVETYENSHSPLRSQTRSQIPWSISPTQLHHSHLGAGRRSGDFAHNDCWPPSPSESGSWSAEQYTIPTTTSPELFVDQVRSRPGSHYNNPVVFPQGRSQGYGHGQSQHQVGNHDTSSQRMAWMIPSESTSVDRGSRHSSPRVPFTPASLSQHFTGGGGYSSMSQSFSSAWSSSSASPLESPSSPVFSPRTHVNYENSYTSSSKGEDDFIAVEEYGDF